MPELTAAEAAEICGGRLVGDAGARARGFVADSRTVAAGLGFVAIRGGHDFVGDAARRGAAFVVCERPDALVAGTTGVVVDDVISALASLASVWRDHLDARAVGITGSTGKTLTKDLLATALATRFRVHATPRSYNAEIGVPLVVLSAPDDAEVLVCELGARRTGEIAELCRIVRPTVGIVTGIGLTHLGIFGSREAIARTKAELVAALPPDGVAVLPAADDFLGLLATSAAARIVTVGPGGTVRVGPATLDARGRAAADVDLPTGRIVVRLPVPGRAFVRNAALAMAATAELGVSPEAAVEAIATAPVSSWRMEVVEIGGRLVVNDAYNANPTSVSAALRTLVEITSDRPRWAVLGPMAELGPVSVAEHRRIGRLAAGLGLERIVVVGEEAVPIAEGAGSVAVCVEGAEEAAALVGAEAPPDAAVLVKGSRVSSLERVVDLLRGVGVTGR